MPNSGCYRNNKQNKISPALLCGIFAVIVLGLANLGLSNILSTKGIEFGQVTSDILQVQSQNKRLKLRLSQLESLAFIEQKAKNLGFVAIDSALTVNFTPQVFANKI